MRGAPFGRAVQRAVQLAAECRAAGGAACSSTRQASGTLASTVSSCGAGDGMRCAGVLRSSSRLMWPQHVYLHTRGPYVQHTRAYMQFPPQSRSLWDSFRFSRGGRDINPDTALYGLIGINIAVFVGWRIDPEFMTRHFLLSIKHLRQGQIHTLVTSMFSHNDGYHLFANMLALYFFGGNFARQFGGSKLIAIYLLGGIVGNLVHHGWTAYQVKVASSGVRKEHRRFMYAMLPPSLGASGGVSSIVLFEVLLFPQSLVYLYGIIPVPAFLFAMLWLYHDASGALGGGPPGAHVAYAAHLGGAAVGAACFLAYRRGLLRPRPYF